MVGLQPSYVHSWSHAFKSNDYGAGPLLRYYFPFGKFAIFPEAAAMFSKYRQTVVEIDRSNGSAPYDEVTHSKTKAYRAGVGLTWFVTPNVGLEAVLAYRKSTETTPQFTGQYGVNKTDTYFNIGLQVYLPRKN
ncbi:MAG: hypothetical protein WDO15_17920 [Bacteroidota bacterium]